MFGSPETTPGGRALKFYSSVRLDIRRIEAIKDGVEVGNRTWVKVVKNKCFAAGTSVFDPVGLTHCIEDVVEHGAGTRSWPPTSSVGCDVRRSSSDSIRARPRSSACGWPTARSSAPPRPRDPHRLRLAPGR